MEVTMILALMDWTKAEQLVIETNDKERIAKFYEMKKLVEFVLFNKKN